MNFINDTKISKIFRFLILAPIWGILLNNSMVLMSERSNLHVALGYVLFLFSLFILMYYVKNAMQFLEKKVFGEKENIDVEE